MKDFFSKYDQIRKKLQIWSHLLKKSLMENSIFCAVETCSTPFNCFFLSFVQDMRIAFNFHFSKFFINYSRLIWLRIKLIIISKTESAKLL